MIGKLTGVVDSVGDDWLILDVNGVGYLVFCSSRTLSSLPGALQKVSLVIETHVREDHIHLYGFATSAEKNLYGLLCTVQGVGARVGLSLLSALSSSEIMMAIASQDKSSLTRANGVGLKLAQRIVLELKDKTAGLDLGLSGDLSPAQDGRILVGSPMPSIAVPEDAVSALVNLGYRRSEAYGAISRVCAELGPETNVEDLIKAGLKELMP